MLIEAEFVQHFVELFVLAEPVVVVAAAAVVVVVLAELVVVVAAAAVVVVVVAEPVVLVVVVQVANSTEFAPVTQSLHFLCPPFNYRHTCIYSFKSFIMYIVLKTILF